MVAFVFNAIHPWYFQRGQAAYSETAAKEMAGAKSERRKRRAESARSSASETTSSKATDAG